ILILAAAAAVRQGEPPQHQFRVIFGLKDKQPTDWSGKIAVAAGEVTALVGWRFEAKDDSVQGTTGWTCSTHDEIAPLKRYPIQGADGTPKGKPVLEPWPTGIHLTVRGASPTVTLKLAKGEVKFAAADVRTGEPKTFLDGQVRVERLPDTRLVRPAAPGKT